MKKKLEDTEHLLAMMKATLKHMLPIAMEATADPGGGETLAKEVLAEFNQLTVALQDGIQEVEAVTTGASSTLDLDRELAKAVKESEAKEGVPLERLRN